MIAFDFEQFCERAAWLEYCDGMSRFAAETEAARRQGKKRFEVMNEISKRNSTGRRNIGPIPERQSTNGLPRVQPAPEKETRPVLERDIHAGRDRLELLAL